MLPPKTPLSRPTYRLLQRLWRRGPGPLGPLLKELGLSRVVGDRIVGQLVQEGIVDLGPDPGGLRLRGDYGSVLGLHVGTATISAALVGFTGELLMTKDFPYPDEGTALDKAVLGAVAAAEPFLRSPTLPPLRGVAVSLPGIVDTQALVLRESNPLKVLAPVPLGDALGRPLGRPVTLENDANCGCWGEAVLRRREDLGNFLFLLVEQRPRTIGDPAGGGTHFGVGAGFYLGGTVHRGSRYSAGEFQSLFREPGSPTQFSLSAAEMALAPEDPVLEERLARELGRHAGFLANILGLDRVILSWPRPEGVVRAAEILRQEIEAHRSYNHPAGCRVELPSMGLLAPAYGAAGLHLENLFRLPGEPAP